MILDITPDSITESIEEKKIGDRKFLLKYASHRELIKDMIKHVESRTDCKKIHYILSAIINNPVYLSRRISCSGLIEITDPVQRKSDFPKIWDVDFFDGTLKELYNTNLNWDTEMEWSMGSNNKGFHRIFKHRIPLKESQLDDMRHIFHGLFEYDVFDTDSLWSSYNFLNPVEPTQDRKLLPIFEEYITIQEIEDEIEILKNIYKSIFNGRWGRVLLDNITYNI